MDSDPQILMATAWNQKGCATCRSQWERGEQPPELAVNIRLHSRLHRCPVCGTYWEQYERNADVIDVVVAQEHYPEVFPHPKKP